MRCPPACWLSLGGFLIGAIKHRPEPRRRAHLGRRGGGSRGRALVPGFGVLAGVGRDRHQSQQDGVTPTPPTVTFPLPLHPPRGPRMTALRWAAHHVPGHPRQADGPVRGVEDLPDRPRQVTRAHRPQGRRTGGHTHLGRGRAVGSAPTGRPGPSGQRRVGALTWGVGHRRPCSATAMMLVARMQLKMLKYRR